MTLPNTVRISARAERDLLRLPEKIGGACLEFIFGPLVDDPIRLGAQLSGPLLGLRSARRGTYRVIYAFDEEAGVVDIVHINHRSDVYR